MERLTERKNDKLIMVKQDNGEYIHAYWDEDNFKAIKKLADYEDLEEQGLLVKLPCKDIPQKPVGDLDSVPHYRCPACNSAVVLYEDSPKYPCCQWCGQKLNWEDANGK